MVFENALRDSIECVRSEEKFSVPLSEEDKNRVIGMWSNYSNGYYYNSESVRLCKVNERLDSTVISLGTTDFYSLLIANVIRPQISEFMQFVKNHYSEGDYAPCMNLLLEYYSTIPECQSFEDLIINGNLPNALAISVMLTDRYDNVLLTKRSKCVGIGKALYGTTATGAVSQIDMISEDPLINCAVRELREELSLIVDPRLLRTVALVAGKVKQQPIAIINGCVDYDLEDWSAVPNCSNFEVDKVFVCKRDCIKDIINAHKFTEAAEYHLLKISGLVD